MTDTDEMTVTLTKEQIEFAEKRGVSAQKLAEYFTRAFNEAAKDPWMDPWMNEGAFAAWTGTQDGSRVFHPSNLGFQPPSSPISAAYRVARAKVDQFKNSFDDNTPQRAKRLCDEISRLMDVVIALDAARDPDDPAAERLLR